MYAVGFRLKPLSANLQYLHKYHINLVSGSNTGRFWKFAGAYATLQERTKTSILSNLKQSISFVMFVYISCKFAVLKSELCGMSDHNTSLRFLYLVCFENPKEDRKMNIASDTKILTHCLCDMCLQSRIYQYEL